MMQALRRSTKTIMIIVAAAFVIGFIFLQLGVNVTGSRGPVITALGSVNGIEITYSMYNDMRSQLLMQMRQSKDSLTDEDFMKIEEQVWDEIVYKILVSQEISNMGITVTDEEILEEMKNNPPDFIKTNDVFLTDGQFDHAKYLQALYSPQNEGFVLELENWYRSYLPIQKLQDYLLSTIHITDNQLKDEYRIRNEKVKVGYLIFNPAELVEDDAVDITDEEIELYYEKNRSKYKVNKQVVLEYVEFPILPNSEDTLATMDAIKEVKELLSEGTPFEEVARDYSLDAGTAEKGGDLGWVPRGRMVKPVDEAAFSLKPGEISDVVTSQYGLHIIKCEDRRKTQERGEEVWLRHILFKLEPSYLTVNEISDRAEDVRNELVRAPDFYSTADSLGIEVKTADPVSRGQYLPEIGPTSVPAAFAFTHSEGDISNVLKVSDKYLIFRVKEIIPEGFKDLAEVRTEIEGKILDEKRTDEARKIAEEARARILESGALQPIADEFEFGVEYKETGEITRRAIVPGIGRYTEFTGTAFGLEEGEISDVITLPNGLFILKVLERIEIDEEAFENAKENLRRELETYQTNSVMSRWYEALKDEAEIEDNRELFFQQS